MSRITLKEDLRRAVSDVHTVTARPMNVMLTGLGGGGAVITCTNALATIQGATSVEIAYNAPITPPHQTCQVSSVQP